MRYGMDRAEYAAQHARRRFTLDAVASFVLDAQFSRPYRIEVRVPVLVYSRLTGKVNGNGI